jgi:tetratricopeptide (TPR) repeat protein
MGLLIVIIVLGAGIGISTFFIVRNLFAPKKIARVEQLLKQNKPGAAIKVAKQNLDKDPRSPEAHYLLGRAYLQDNRPELALMEFRAVNQIGQFEGVVPEIPFRRQIAELFARFNQPEEALKEYLLLIQKDPNTADHYYKAGLLFEDRNKATKAVNYYRKAIQLQPGHGMAHLQLGYILYRAKRFSDALDYLQKALRFQPDHYDAHYYIGRIQKENKDYAAALQSFEWAAKAPALRTKSLIERGTSYMEMNNLERAVSELERALTASKSTEPADLLWAHFFLATCYERLRQIERAIEHWEAVYREKPGFQDVAEKLSQYQDLRQDDHIKDFLTASQSDFRGMCEKITASLGYSIQNLEDQENGVRIVAVESGGNWRSNKKMPRLIQFIRVAEAIDEATVREIHETMRTQNMIRAMIISSSTYTRTAAGFAESRPLELYNKDHLQEFLKKVL